MNVDRCADAATEDCVSSEKDGLSESTSCAVCSLECSRDRTCTSCNKFMHHFCSHEVCMAMKVFDAEGNRIEDFGDSCYCSKYCFVNDTSTFDAPCSTQFFAVSDSNNECTMLENIPANRVSGKTTMANANTKK
ncbi:hypothetical protein PF010_g25368 [Phytophthora fragariae]|uniref:Uncharacterized protein n=1 Tax=Phytophthora fragariae TaxID=53985 RepID=A0A6A3PLR1_9STRA|nr:hypothetical protein PF006_g31020 [Phytophthora fragariae]KAE9072734.1 hypothetical protein PF010_g25368 [Phytophthora fragariae]KAE9265156.1 hypothetical protein PF001_g31011 [Phytophthora fragariae]